MRRKAWLAGAALLFALAMWLGSSGEARMLKTAASPKKQAFPHYGDEETWERSRKRLTLPPLAPSSDNAVALIPQRRDPLLASLAPQAKVNLIFEASAIRDSPLGKLLLDCFAKEGVDVSDSGRNFGINPLTDIDRLAISDESVIMTGNFPKARWEHDGVPYKGNSYGDKATIYETAGEMGRAVAAAYDSQLVILGSKASALEAIDRIEGRDNAASPIATNETYGEVYGIVNTPDLAALLPNHLGDKLRDAATRLEVHVDARDDVLIVVDVSGPEGPRVDELSRALGAALTLARVKARADGDKNLEQLLDRSRVSPSGNSFRIEVALPLSLIAEPLSHCGRGDAGRRKGGD